MGSSEELAVYHVSGNHVPNRQSALEEDPEEETDLLRQYIQEKTADDGAFALKLLNLLRDGTLEQQVNALEQLAFIDQSEVSQRVKEWLCEKPRHPHHSVQSSSDA